MEYYYNKKQTLKYQQKREPSLFTPNKNMVFGHILRQDDTNYYSDSYYNLFEHYANDRFKQNFNK